MSSSPVFAKKHLGQHFLKDQNIAKKIVDSLSGKGFENVLEIGPGTGILTSILLQEKKYKLLAQDVDKDSIDYLKASFPNHAKQFELKDFLKTDLNNLFGQAPFAVIGNFPYNISSQILFKVLDHREHIPELVGMFQKEVAQRVAIGPGSKLYGIISVLIQAHYDIEYLFTVHEHVFQPPPKVKSAVIRLRKKTTPNLNCDEVFFKTIVKTAFNQRRKTLRNSLKPFLEGIDTTDPIFQSRPETLSVENFATLTNQLQKVK